MMRMIKVEIEKLFCGSRLYLGIAGILLGICLTSLSELPYNAHSDVHDMYLGSHTEAFSLVCFILCVVGGGISFCMEQKSQSIRYIVLRGNTRNYAVSKILSAFLGGYLVTLVGMVLGEFFLTFPLYIQQGDWGVLTSHMDEIGLDILETLIMSFRYGLLSVTALLVSVYISDLFITMIMPLVLYYAYLNISGWFHFPLFLDITWMIRASFDADSFTWNQFFGDIKKAFLFSLFVVYVMGYVIVKKMKGRVENG